MIILEGPDKCGKSTFIKNAGIPEVEYSSDNSLSIPDSKVIAIHSKVGDDSMAVLQDALWLEDHGCQVYLDRSWISEVIYGQIYRNTYFSPTDELAIIEELRKRNVIILYFTCEWRTLCTRLFNGDEYERDTYHMRRVWVMYDSYMNEIKKDIPVYNITW